MVTPKEVIDAIGLVKSAITALRDERSRSEFGYPNDHFRKIGSSLSNIYFDKDGILGVLKKIDRNGIITEDDKRALHKFNDREELINNAIENLVLDYGKHARNSIRQARIIEGIRGRKLSLRNAIQYAINEALTFDRPVPVNREYIHKLVVGIEQLNSEIELAEHELRKFRT